MDTPSLDNNANFDLKTHDNAANSCIKDVKVVIKKLKKPDYSKNTLLKQLLGQIIIRESSRVSREDENELSNMMGNLLSFRNASDMSVAKK